MTIDKLLNQLSHLTVATESNNQLTKLIFNEVSAESSRPKSQGESQKAFRNADPSTKSDTSELRNLIRSQTKILEEHKVILSQVESASKELKSKKTILGKDNNDVTVLMEQFVDGIGEFQNLVSVLIHQNGHIQKSLRASKSLCNNTRKYI
jgi:hypothetical protein